MKSLRIIGHDSSSFFVIDENRKTNFLRLTAYHLENSTTRWVVKIQLEEDEKLESVTFLDSTFVLFTSKTDQSNKKLQSSVCYWIILEKRNRIKSRYIKPHSATLPINQNLA
ncbi:MAG: hypothetical protein IPP69_07620 [Flavobacteriales bacterium]|nr:hypothetical protein [Flavobacteriales bacterium]